MGRVNDLMNRSLLSAWGLVDEKTLEREFDLTSRNVGGAHSEKLENNHENRSWKAHLTVIPTYSSRHDPHLAQYHKNQRRLRKQRARQRGGRTPKGPNGEPRKEEIDIEKLGEGGDWENRGQHFDDAKRSQVCPESYIVSTEHVLDLKRVFYRGSEEESYDTSAPPHARIRRVPRQSALFYYQRGVETTNAHCKLHRRSPIKPTTLKRLLTVLRAVSSEEGLDWPTFLLLCTINVGNQKELRRLLILKDAHDRYLTTYQVDSERDFCKMLLYLNGGALINNTDQIVSFYQNGDFYQSRGSFTSFAETVFSLYEHFTQTYIARARGRGTRLTTNFSGHSPPGNVGGAVESGYEKLFPIKTKNQAMWDEVVGGNEGYALLRGRQEWLP